MTTLILIIEALVALDCSVNAADVLECVMKEDGIVVAECQQAHGSDNLECTDVYADGE